MFSMRRRQGIGLCVYPSWAVCMGVQLHLALSDQLLGLDKQGFRVVGGTGG